MSIGLNIHGQNVKDWARLAQFMTAAKPRWTLVMDDLKIALDIKRLVTSCNVIFRAWPDDNLVDVPPEEWIKTAKFVVGDDDIWCYAGNEMGFSDRVLNWTCEVIELAVRKNIKIVVGNFSSGTPDPLEWERPAAQRLLRLAMLYNSNVVLGLHEYACGVITSGMGYPTPVAVWPQDISGRDNWHCGRFWFLIRACQKYEIPLPRVIITEHGFDDMSDVAAWRDTLIKTDGYTNIRGWKSLAAQWRQWFPNWTAEYAYFRQLAHADKYFYSHPAIEAQLIFSWGASSQMWEQFDISQAYELQGLIMEYQGQAVPQPTLPVAGTYQQVTITGANYLNLRELANSASADKGDLKTGDVIFIRQDAAPLVNGGYTWLYVDQYRAGVKLVAGVWLAATHAAIKDGYKATTAPVEPAPQTAAVALDDVRKWITWLIKGNEELTVQISQNTAMIAALQKLLPS